MERKGDGEREREEEDKEAGRRRIWRAHGSWLVVTEGRAGDWREEPLPSSFEGKTKPQVVSEFGLEDVGE